MKIPVTGAAGFIGMHVSKALLNRGDEIIDIDSLKDYSGIRLKPDRLKIIEDYDDFIFIKMDMANRQVTRSRIDEHNFDRMFNSTAQASARYSLENPYAYVDSNLFGFVNILRGCRHTNVEHLVYASSSST